jgi:ABC-type transport system involved in cytochrome bd biosynthesis fused ATPase/permease subunit
MRTSTGLTLIAVGCVLILAVNIPTPFLSLRVAGFVILATGVAGLRVPQLTYRWLRQNKEAIRQVLEQLPEPADRNRVPLDALLGTQPR